MNLKLRHAFMRVVDRLTQVAYRLSGGWLGGRQGRYNILLLDSTGRVTGQRRTHALLYVREGERYVVCASNFGAPRHPAWYLNLLAHPQASIQAGRARLEVVATRADGAERERLWQLLRASWRLYDNYQAGTTRLIPVVILTPRMRLDMPEQ